MRNWGIKKRVLFLAIMPTLVIALTLAFYFNINHINYIEDTLHKRGQTIANNLAPACEYSIFSGNPDILENLILKIITEDDIINVTVTNSFNEALISQTKSKLTQYPASISTTFIEDKQIIFTAPIVSTAIAVDELDELYETGDATKTPTTRIIGHVFITMSSLSTRVQQVNSLIKGFLITLIGLVITVFIAIKISRGVTNPILSLTSAVNKIARGELGTRIKIDSAGEIGSLERGVNKMTDEIQSVRQDLELQVNKATSKLKKTLDELEIQNIELDIARNQALSASRIKSEFLANMSHEIRTPMNGVLGFAELLDKTELNQQQKDFVTTIRSSASNLLTVINDILDFSKIESGKLNIDHISFKLPEIMDETISMFAPMAYKNDIELIYHPLPDIPDVLVGDPSRIRQILINLIGNAIKFTNQGYVIIRVLYTLNENSVLNLKFTVSDTGIGMDEDSCKRLFTAFTQADTSISRKFGGTGLGLVISKKLAELMNGDIGFDSEPNKGSTFWLSLPFEIDDTLTHKQPISKTNRGRILVFDPSTQNRIAMRAILGSLGFETIETSRIDKIANLINENNQKPVTAIIAGINRTNIDNIGFINNLSLTLSSIDLPHIILASTYEDRELENIRKTGVSNLLYRCSKQNNITDTLLSLIHEPKDITSHDIDNEQAKYDLGKWKNLNVLLVDDNEINLKLAKTILNNQVINVNTCANGEEAVKLTSKNKYDLILMDLHMPKCDGFNATKQIRQTKNPSQHAIIIALTANAMPDEQLEIFNTGMNDILLKPVSANQLFELMDTWLSSDLLKQDNNTEIKPAPDTDTDTNTNTDKSTNANIYNEDEGIKLAGGSKQLSEELFGMLIKELPAHQKRIEQAYRKKDGDTLKQAVHKLHGATSYCGTQELRKYARAFELIIDNNETHKLEDAYLKTIESIKRLIGYHNNISAH
ncbi:MAG: ATP-binding protein [Gammaproteobacteria bacterium]|nr:ATP-binding protein [Gammaproteobacteria bacterium]